MCTGMMALYAFYAAIVPNNNCYSAVNMERVLLENAAMAEIIQGALADRDEMARRTQDR